jgi:xanthine dehydrogenase accessory factor
MYCHPRSQVWFNQGYVYWLFEKVVIMRDVFPAIEKWNDEGARFAIAVVVKTWGSSPRKIGSWMVVSESGEFQGSVSGGCVEGAVIDESIQAVRENRSKLLHFGVADEAAWDVGLACGGEIDVFVRPFPLFEDVDGNLLDDLKGHLERNDPFVLAMIIDGPEELVGRTMVLSDHEPASNSTGDQLEAVQQVGKSVDRSRRSQIRPAEILGDEVNVFYNFYPPKLKLVIVGGAHISISLAAYARELGYLVYLVDPRGIFGSQERFPQVEGLINAWPDHGLAQIGLDAYTAVAVLSHDPKLDDPALHAALQSDAFYIGALGSRTTQEKRRGRLLEAGFQPEQIERLHGPIGLDLGGTSPEEVALSIMAEIVSIHAQSVQGPI